MFVATGGVNTHKGGIFSLGLLCAAAGRLTQRNVELTQRSLCEETRVICRGIVEQELKKSGVAKTKGEQLFQTFGFTGARGKPPVALLPSARLVFHCWKARSNWARLNVRAC
jgi:triphosphoribosyl-dephospho-CoA synthase